MSPIVNVADGRRPVSRLQRLLRIGVILLVACPLVVWGGAPASAAPIRVGGEAVFSVGSTPIISGGCVHYPDGRNVIITRWFSRGATAVRCIQTAKINFVFQPDGNLVVYRRLAPGGAVWSSGTAGRGAHVDFQTDGNLVVYNSLPAPVWSSRTAGSADTARLNVQSDGNVVIYRGGRAIWATGTRY